MGRRSHCAGTCARRRLEPREIFFFRKKVWRPFVSHEMCMHSATFLYAESGQTLIFSNFRNFQNFRNFSKFQNFQKFSKKIQKFRKISKIFKIVGRGAVQKLGERVVLGKNCPLRILLQNMVSTQPRTSPGKIASLRQILPNFRRSCRLLRRPFRKFFDAGRCKSWGCG